MKLYLPHREVNLDTNLNFEDRNRKVFEVLEEEIEFHSEKMTVEEYFRRTWDKPQTKVCLDVIGYFLTKNNTTGEDREVLSNKKQKEIRKGSKRHITFSGLGYEDQVSIGILDEDDFNK